MITAMKQQAGIHSAIVADVIDAIAGVRTDFRDKPLEDQVIKSMEIDTLGVDYPEPEKC